MKITLINQVLAQVGDRTQVTISPLGSDPTGVLTNIVNAFLIIGGILAVAAVVVGGYQIMMSQGDPAGIEKGKKTITQAIIGVIIISASMIILHTTVECTKSIFSLTCLG